MRAPCDFLNYFLKALTSKKAGLLHALGTGFGVDERFENGEDVAAVLHHSGEKIAQRRVVLGFAMPLQLYGGRNFNVPAKLFCGVTAQKKAVKKGRLSLREVKIVLRLIRRINRGEQRRVGNGLH